MMWTCSEKIFESIPSLTKRLIKSLFEIGNFVPKICRFRRWEKLIYEFSNKVIPCLNWNDGSFQAISGAVPHERKRKSINLIDVVGTLGISQSKVDFIEETVDVGMWEQQLRPRIPLWEPGAILS
ncbi:hypothetical protein Tco_0394353 [Tanacetum coccineum]